MKRHALHWFAPAMPSTPSQPPAARFWQFTLKRLLVSVTLVAIGLGMTSFVWRESHQSGAPNYPPAVVFLAWFGGGMLIGAGLFTPVRLWWVGAVLGIAVQMGLAMILFQPVAR